MEVRITVNSSPLPPVDRLQIVLKERKHPLSSNHPSQEKKGERTLTKRISGNGWRRLVFGLGVAAVVYATMEIATRLLSYPSLERTSIPPRGKHPSLVKRIDSSIYSDRKITNTLTLNQLAMSAIQDPRLYHKLNTSHHKLHALQRKAPFLLLQKVSHLLLL